MVKAVEAAGVPNMVWFNYRRVPSIALAKQLVDEGRIGTAFHYRATYLQDWTISPDVPQGGAALWRLDVNVAGSGVTGDLLAHSIDTAMWLNGPITRVVGKDADLRHGAQACGQRQSGARRHRRCLHVPRRVRQRFDGHVRIHALCARPQELQHVRAERRRWQRLLRSRRARVSAVLRIHAAAIRKEDRIAPDRLAQDSHDQLRTSHT